MSAKADEFDALYHRWCERHGHTPDRPEPPEAERLQTPLRLMPPEPLYRHQVGGIGFLVQRSSALLADEPGLGKTAMAILAAEAVMDRGGQALVVAPTSLLLQWAAEIRRWTGGLRTPRVLRHSERPDRLGRWTIVSYDRLKQRSRLNVALEATRWSVLICDEAHRAGNPATRRARALATFRADRRWLLTATPVRNRTDDVYGLLSLAGHPDGIDRPWFRDRFGTLRQRPMDGDLAELSRVAADWLLRRTKTECLDLPSKTRIELPVEVPAAIRYLRPSSIGSLQRARVAVAAAKVPAVAELVADLARSIKVLVFSEFLEPLSQLERRLIALHPVRLDGSLSPAQRAAAIARFQSDPACRVLLGQTEAAGEGLNLTAASAAVFLTLSLAPYRHVQAEDRMHRIGQNRPVTVTTAIAECPVDRAVAELFEAKRRLVETFDAAVAKAQAVKVAIDPAAVLRRLRTMDSFGPGLDGDDYETIIEP